MLKHHSSKQARNLGSTFLLVALILPIAVLGMTGCNFFQPSTKHTIRTSDGKKIDLNDQTVKQYVAEWHESKASIERLSSMEDDLAFLLSEVSKMSDLGQTPGMDGPVMPHSLAPTAPLNSDMVNTESSHTQANHDQINPDKAQPLETTVTAPYNNINSAPTASSAINVSNAFCPEIFTNHYKKNIAVSSFPRVSAGSSKVGALHQVEQHLPMLLGANLHNRHQMLTPTPIRDVFASASRRGELLTAAHAQTLAQQHRFQYLISGEVDDMSMSFPDTVEKPSYYTRFISGAHNLLHINTPLDKRSRVFSFTLEARDGVTGQLVFSHQYRTFGQWKPSPEAEIGFGSARFWSTDYGMQIQQLVAIASDELASALHCQPYMARIDSSPHQQHVVIHSGANNGMRSGDALDLYQLVYQPVAGEYQKFDTRLVRHNSRVYLTEVYPSHSVGQVTNDMILGGHYVVKAQ